jgi:hypothetical protein
VPRRAERSDAVQHNEQKNLVVCPIPHDGSFMEVFYEGWQIVQALCASDFKMPREVDLPNAIHRQVARVYVERREFKVLEVYEATAKFAQPHLLDTKTEKVPSAPFADSANPGTGTVIGPFPLGSQPSAKPSSTSTPGRSGSSSQTATRTVE